MSRFPSRETPRTDDEDASVDTSVVGFLVLDRPRESLDLDWTRSPGIDVFNGVGKVELLSIDRPREL